MKEVIKNENLTDAIINLRYQGQLPTHTELCVRLNNIFGQINHAIRTYEERTYVTQEAPRVLKWWQDGTNSLDYYDWNPKDEEEKEESRR